MNVSEFEREVRFGLENLTRVRSNVLHILSQNVDSVVRLSALTYECLGYYNALEHLFLRFIKFIGRKQPSGAFSHRDTLRTLEVIAGEYEVDLDPHTLQICLELMAFRHVATKIYGFLIDEAKLIVIVSRVEDSHEQIIELVEDLLHAVQQRNDR